MPEAKIVNFEPYLRSLITTYEQWWQLYTLTEVTRQTQLAKYSQYFLFVFNPRLCLELIDWRQSLQSIGSSEWCIELLG